MSGMHVFWARMRAYFQNRRDEARLNEELRSHLEMLAEEYLAQGVPPDEARKAARRAMGGIEQMKEAHRDERRFAALSALWQDLRYAARQLRKTPGLFSCLHCNVSCGYWRQCGCVYRDRPDVAAAVAVSGRVTTDHH